jgi:hypothetical protein
MIDTGVDIAYRWITEHEQEMNRLKPWLPVYFHEKPITPMIGVAVSYIQPDGKRAFLAYYMPASEYPGI